ncbi:TonB-dependent receptor [Uliginosibacterium flavum]|uniref:TonB-dependent receptor n=1 Tax=Uliginosibacterium flavum TaxID=1396831 RepID=A0ABV2TLR5_9RHOO
MYQQQNTSSAATAAGLRRKAIFVALSLALAGPALAQTATPAGDKAKPAPAATKEKVQVMKEVKVVGQAASLDSALDVQQMADNVVSVVHADAIGQLPDSNAAEALQRVPGVSVERDQGEGRYVRIRGLGPDLNSVTINGSLVPSPESGRRAVALDVLPAGLIRSLEVSKTLTPDQDANSIGGTVDVKTLSAFDHPGQFASVEAGASHDTLVSKTSPNMGAAWSNRFLGDKLGVAAALSASQRKFGSTNTETGGAWDGDKLEEFQRRDYQITRERVGGGVNFDFRPEKGQQYYLRTLLSRYKDEEVRQRHNIEFDDAQAEGQLGDAESSRELKARKETQDIQSIVLGGERTLGLWDLALVGGFSRASEKSPRHIAAAKFESGETYTAGFSNSQRPELLSSSAINNAADYELDSIELEEQNTRDTERNLRFDLSRKFKAMGGDNQVKFGAKSSRRTKTNELTVWDVDGGDLGNPSLSGLSSNVDYAWGDYGPGISDTGVKGLLNGVNLADYLDDEQSRVNDFTMREKTDAAYLQNTYSIGLWRILGGVRYQATRFQAEGTGVRDGDFVATQARSGHRDWLPALHVRRDLDNDTTVRAAWSNSVVRPTFEQLAPGFVIDGDEAEFGNPDLKPMKSGNFDLGIERRLGYAGVVSAYAFHKQIRNFVYNTDLAGTGDWASFDAAHTYANGDQAQVTGLELAFSQPLRFLPAPWNGLLVGTNATFSQSSARIAGQSGGSAAARDIPLPSQSKRALNFTLGYDQGPWNLRLAANHKSKYLLEVVDIGDADKDQYVDAQTHYDFSARYSVTKQVQVVFEALNLSDEKYYVYAGNASRNAQYESYGRTYKLGLKTVF